MTSKFMTYVDNGDFKNLFIEELGWDQPTAKPITVEMPDGSFDVVPVAGFHGLHVWACGSLPDRTTQAQIDREVSATSTERLIIFHDGSKQEWRWPRYNKNRGTNMSKLLVHEHTIGSQHSALEQRLEKIALDIDHEITLVQLLEKMRTAFDVEESEESSKAAKVMAKLYYELESHLPQDGAEASGNLHKISVTLARILFLVFADDTMMWEEENLFQNFVAFETARDGSDLTASLEQLFEVLNTEEKKRTDVSGYLARFKYVNGGIFSEEVKLPDLGSKMRELLLEASRFDWGNISPAIFGSMFQAVKSRDLRRELGAHYTSEKDILKTLKPLFLDELHEEFERAKKLKDPTRPLKALRERLGQLKVLDPACGCGNFLIVAYRELRELELQIMEALQEYRGDDGQRSLDATIDLRVSMTQIFGIEIDEWPARIAETALHLMDRQCNLRLIEKFGQAPERLPISEAAKITVANALRIDWEDIATADDSTIVVGNPPFAGQKEVGKDRNKVLDMKSVWGSLHHGYMDYVTAWYKKASDFLRHTNSSFAFVSTSSICQGQPVAATWQPLLDAGWGIAFAHRPFNWVSEASGKAGVHVVIVGLSKRSNIREPRLFDYPASGKGEAEELSVSQINPYLLELPNIVVRSSSKPVSKMTPSMTVGSMLWDFGHLVVGPQELAEVESDPIAKEYLRPFLSNTTLLKGSKRWVLWLVDSSEAERSESPVLRDRLELVRKARLGSSDKEANAKAATPHLFTSIRQPVASFLAIPKVTGHNREYVPAAHGSREMIVNNTLFTAADPDGYIFSIVSSRMFTTWQRLVGGHTRADTNFSNTLVWNTFPMAFPDESFRSATIAAGENVISVRARYSSSTLEALYDPARMPPGLREAHQALDDAVYACFGMASHASEEERQRTLLRSYEDSLRRQPSLL
ncbi:class I SAM-dependent DNA methyltransferase [Arthrobacter sp. KNU-44]|uniref:class I SAM-dependent DNA methyltransferase n=1 Tax=Arthrobacter sp. KNU-44 TaxID=3450744 RepID=UPI003F4232A9